MTLIEINVRDSAAIAARTLGYETLKDLQSTGYGKSLCFACLNILSVVIHMASDTKLHIRVLPDPPFLPRGAGLPDYVHCRILKLGREGILVFWGSRCIDFLHNDACIKCFPKNLRGRAGN